MKTILLSSFSCVDLEKKVNLVLENKEMIVREIQFKVSCFKKYAFIIYDDNPVKVFTDEFKNI